MIVGGIKSLGKVTEILSPLMVLLYVSGGLITVIIFASNLPQALEMIFVGAFKPSAFGGGVVGITVANAMRYGMARGNYSNEAGIGTAAVFHAAAKTSEPATARIPGITGCFYRHYGHLHPYRFSYINLRSLDSRNQHSHDRQCL